MDFVAHMKYELPTPSQLFTPVTTTLLVLCVVGFGLMTYVGEWATAWLVLDPHYMIRGRIWTLLTYPFMESCIWWLVTDCFILLLIGSAVEREWRSRSVVTLWLVVTVICGLLWTLVCLVLGKRYFMGGPAPGCFGLIAAFGLLYQGRRFLWLLVTVEAQTFAWILIGIGCIFCIPVPINLLTVLGGPLAYGYMKLLWWWSAQEQDRAAGGGDYRPSGFVDID